MRTLARVAAAACLAAGALVTAAGTASAVTIEGDPCSEIDYTVANGSTVVFTFANCGYGGYSINAGDPTVVFSDGGSGGQPLIWYQSVSRASDSTPCADGWTASWAQWPHEGNGGPTCDRAINWGTGPSTGSGTASLWVTINTINDWVELNSDANNYVTGCNVDADFYDNHVDLCDH